jgi:Bacterial membrane protein YfhO
MLQDSFANKIFMQVIQNTRKRIYIYFILLLFLVIAYLPLSSFLFALKNDALTANFPNKYFFSAALHSGYLPVWNPYVNFGLPLYADPGFAFWNPITWIFGWLGYSVPMLTVEILFYIWLAGISMYELGKWLGHSSRISFSMGIMYMCCGFFVGNLQHTNFLTCAAFLPLVTKTWLNLQKSFNIQKLLFCEAALYMMATGGHPAIPFACLYFLFFVQAAIIILDSATENRIHALLRSFKVNLILFIGFIALAAPLLYSYIEIYSRFTRSDLVIQSSYSDTGFDPASYLSFIFPFSTTANDTVFSNDPLMRNGYFSLAGLICLGIVLLRRKNNFQKIFLFSGIAMLILSLGGTVKEFLYPLMPLLDHIRTNGEFRVFSLLSFIVAGSYLFAELLEGDLIKQFNRILLILAGISSAIILCWFVFAASGIHKSMEAGKGFLRNIKLLLEEMPFFDRIFINAVMILLITAGYFLLRKRIRIRILLPLMLMTDLIMFNWSQLPVTGVQLLSPYAIQHYFSDVPAGIPKPELEPVIRNQSPDSKLPTVVGCWSYYSKQPGTPFQCSYPSILNSTKAYFKSPLPDSINQKPFIFTTNPGLNYNLQIVSFAPSEISLTVEAENQDSLILLQNNYFRWKATVNGRQVAVRPAAIAFMSIPLEKGANEVSFYFDSRMILIIVIFSSLLWILFITAVWRKKKPEF